MLNYLKKEADMTLTENGAVTYKSTASDCLDLFAVIGAIRKAPEKDIIDRFIRAYAEDADKAMKILFFGRDIRGGLGERRVFRIIVNWLADNEPESVRKNIEIIPEYGRFDDLLALIGTGCEPDAVKVIRRQLTADMTSEGEVSLLAKWLPSVNCSSKENVRLGKRIARLLGMSEREYRKLLAALRRKIRIIENNLREKNYTFDYSKQPAKAMYKYRNAFLRNDGERYGKFLEQVNIGAEKMHTGTLMPYDVINSCLEVIYDNRKISDSERRAIDVTWNSMKDFTNVENALVVVDGSGSMYGDSDPIPISVALSLGIYFAERNTGAFHNHFITFSATPQLVEIKGGDILGKVRSCVNFNEVANTDLSAVFELILKTALTHSVPREDLPKKIFIISDMEFDYCMYNADVTNFESAKKQFESYGYQLPEIVFWNVASRNRQQPVTKNEQGAALVSGCNPRLFSMVAGGIASPYSVMMEIINSERYAPISA